MFELALTGANVAVAIVLAYVTWSYTKATKRMSDATDLIANLELERKVWEVQPVLVPYVREIEGAGISPTTKDMQRPLLELGLKNIGRGIAVIQQYHMDFNEFLYQESYPYNLPLYCGAGDVFFQRRIENTEQQEFKRHRWIIAVEYSDMHGNKYYMSLTDGDIKTGPGRSPYFQKEERH